MIIEWFVLCKKNICFGNPIFTNKLLYFMQLLSVVFMCTWVWYSIFCRIVVGKNILGRRIEVYVAMKFPIDQTKVNYLLVSLCPIRMIRLMNNISRCAMHWLINYEKRRSKSIQHVLIIHKEHIISCCKVDYTEKPLPQLSNNEWNTVLGNLTWYVVLILENQSQLVMCMVLSKWF